MVGERARQIEVDLPRRVLAYRRPPRALSQLGHIAPPRGRDSRGRLLRRSRRRLLRLRVSCLRRVLEVAGGRRLLLRRRWLSRAYRGSVPHRGIAPPWTRGHLSGEGQARRDATPPSAVMSRRYLGDISAISRRDATRPSAPAEAPAARAAAGSGLRPTTLLGRERRAAASGKVCPPTGGPSSSLLSKKCLGSVYRRT